MKQSLFAGVLMLAMISSCGRSDIEEAQRSWLEEEHRVSKRLLEVRTDHNELSRRLDPSRAAELADSASFERFTRATAMLRDHETKLNSIDTTIDRHQLARDVAIRADDDEAVATGWSKAKIDYESSLAALDAIDTQNDEIGSIVNDIRFREPADTIGTNRTDTAAAGGADHDTHHSKTDRSDETIDNTIGRDAPDEPK